jgi:HEAT repeat protein
MIEALAIAAIALTAVNVLFVAVLVARRLYLARRERESAELEARVTPFAHHLVDAGTLARTLDNSEEVALARVLARMSRLVKGDARANIGAYFASGSAYAAELSALDSRRAWRRAAAAFALGDMATELAVPRLLPAVDDGNRDVRAAAARSLGRLQATEAVEPLVSRLADGSLPRIVAGSALLAIGDAALPQLRALLGHGDPHVRATATELVGLLGGGSDAEALEPALADPDARVRAEAAAAMGRIGSRRAAEGLVAALSDDEPSVRAAAAAALGVVRERAAVPRLLELAETDAFEPARAAARAAFAIDRAAVEAAASRGPHLQEVVDLAAV